MRSYPRNSPHAAARIVALALLADGNLCKSELEALERLGAHAALGLSPAELHKVVHDLCQDLLAASGMAWGGSSCVDPRTLAGLLAEVQDPQLQLTVMQLCIAVVETDEHWAEGESAVLAATLTQWGLPQPEPQVQPALQQASAVPFARNDPERGRPSPGAHASAHGKTGSRGSRRWHGRCAISAQP